MAGALPASPRLRRVERIAAQLQGRRHVDRAVERAGEEATEEGAAADRGGAGASQLRRVAQADRVGRGDRDQAGDEDGGEGRATGERPQRAQHPVGIDAGRIDGEGDHHRGRAQAERQAGDECLGGDVDLAEQRPLAEAGEDRLAAPHHQRVDDDHQQRQRHAHPQRGANGVASAREQAGEDRGGEDRGEHEGARVDEGDGDKRAEVGDGGPRRRRLERARPRRVGKRRSHRIAGNGVSFPASVATA